MVKDAEEIERMRQAATLGARLFARALEVIRPGLPEAEVAAEMELMARRLGAEGMSFPTIIAAGRRSALPHGRASNASSPLQLRGLRLRCYTHGLLFRHDSYCVHGSAFSGGPARVPSGAASATDGHGNGKAGPQDRRSRSRCS